MRTLLFNSSIRGCLAEQTSYRVQTTLHPFRKHPAGVFGQLPLGLGLFALWILVQTPGMAQSPGQATPAIATPTEALEPIAQLSRVSPVGGQQDAAAATRERLAAAEARLQAGDVFEAMSLAHDLFLSSPHVDVRERSYAILVKHAPHLLKPHTREIRILVPNVTCFGRFQDALIEQVCKPHAWIHQVTVTNTGMVRKATKGLTLGTVAELIFCVDRKRSPQELLQAIKDSQQFQLSSWSVLIELPAPAVLSGSYAED